MAGDFPALTYVAETLTLAGFALAFHVLADIAAKSNAWACVAFMCLVPVVIFLPEAPGTGA